MKRALFALLVALLFTALLSGCTGNNDFPVADSGTAISEGSSEVMDGGTANTKEQVIHLLTDLGHNAMRAHGTYDQFNAQYVMDQFLENMGELPEGYRLEVEVMPVEEAEFQSRLTRLRTEIMSGQGPDIYVLSSADMAPIYHQERVFPNTQKAMEDGFFLPLDDYMENAQFMKIDDMNPTVMAAGCTPEGRFVLPMRYTFGAVRTTEPVTDTGEGWFEVINGTDEVLASSYAAAAYWNLHYIFEETVDTESKTLTFSEEELYNAVVMALKWYGTNESRFPKQETILQLQIDGSSRSLYGWDPEWKDIATYIPLRNREGGVTATVTGYIAISRNTSYPDEAFHVVDIMMSKKFQNGQKFWTTINYDGYVSSTAVFSWSRGVSVYDDFLRESTPMNYEGYINDQMYPTYCELRDKITNARIMNDIDQTLLDMYYQAWRNSMTPGDELKKYVKQEYNKMVLMAGEL